jgi:tetratricopeptide (TPR) repeat protein
MTPAGHAEARNHLKLALEIDPSSARAWSLLSLCRYHEGILGWVHRADALKSSLEAAEQAVLCDDREWLAQGLWGMGRLWTERDFQSALDGVEQAVALNPSAPLARHFLACILEFTGCNPARYLDFVKRREGRSIIDLVPANRRPCP